MATICNYTNLRGKVGEVKVVYLEERPNWTKDLSQEKNGS